MSSVELKSEYELNAIYYVKFNSAKHRATLLLIGDLDECNDRLESITSYLPNADYATKINKKQAPKAAAAITDKNRESCKIELLESQVSTMDQKIKEFETKVVHYIEQISNLEKKNQVLENKVILKDTGLDQCTKEKLLAVGLCILNNFGSFEHVQSLLIAHPADEINKEVHIDIFTDF